MYTSVRLQVGMRIEIKEFWFPCGNREHVFFTPVGTLAWPSRQSFHYRHWAVNIVESVRQDTIEYWRNKFEIRVRLWRVNKARVLLICFLRFLWWTGSKSLQVRDHQGKTPRRHLINEQTFETYCIKQFKQFKFKINHIIKLTHVTLSHTDWSHLCMDLTLGGVGGGSYSGSQYSFMQGGCSRRFIHPLDQINTLS